MHFADIEKLLEVLDGLSTRYDALVIEHNLDVIKQADYLVDLGPEGGEAGGEIVASGTPEDVAAVDESYTGQFLRPLLERAAWSPRELAKQTLGADRTGAVRLVVFIGGMAAAWNKRHHTICSDGKAPVAQRGGLLGQTEYRCHDGRVVTTAS